MICTGNCDVCQEENEIVRNASVYSKSQIKHQLKPGFQAKS